jgi:uncharacterized protein DUF397
MIVEAKGMRINTDDLTFRKSSFSGGNCDNCVEVAFLPGATVVRDSKAPEAVPLVFTRAEWNAFVAGVEDHQFDGI